jgi:hypothetical protein
MWRWLFAGKDELPYYSLLDAVPSRGLPQELADREASADYEQWRDRIEADLFSEATNESAPGFATFLKSGDGLQIFLPESDKGCLLVFSTVLRAADYRTQAPERKFAFFCSSAAQVVSVVAELRERASIDHVALDRCPRCSTFMTVGSSSLDTAAKVIKVWKISKATEIARCNLYFDHAQAAARAGQFLTARDVALELVGHVTAEDPRVHLLLGKLAVQLRDKTRLREGKRFLTLLKQGEAVEELQDAHRTRSVQL